MLFIYSFLASIGLLSAALAGLIAERHFVVMMVCIELILLSSVIALVTFMSYSQNPGGDGIILLISLWAVAAVEVIALITFYVFMKSQGFDFDVSKLSDLKR